MSDDTDERMDRAKRIRQMREGQRAAAAESATQDSDADEESVDDGSADDGANDESAADDGATDDTVAEDAAAPADVADEAATDDSASSSDDDDESSNDATPDSGDETIAGDTTDGGSTEMRTDASTETTTDDAGAQDTNDGAAGSGPEVDEDVMAAAQRAAQNAAQMSGEGVAQVAAAGTGTEAAQTDAAEADASQPDVQQAGTAPAQGPTGVELPDQETVQSAIADEVLESGETSGTARARGVEEQAAAKEETVRVLEFTLGSEYYCLDITHVEEIVKRESITRVPNTPECVEGVVDLRGQITTILNPKDLLDIDRDGPESLLVVFDPEGFEDQGAIGWIVDEVRQVTPVAESEINDPPVDEDYIEGVVDRDDEDEFVIWTDPEVAIRLATADGDDED